MVTMFSADPLDCLLACLSNSECKSVNYLNESYIGGIKRTCEVIDETKGTRPPCFVRRPGSTYWGPENVSWYSLNIFAKYIRVLWIDCTQLKYTKQAVCFNVIQSFNLSV